GLPSVSAFINFAWGNNAEDPNTDENLADATEYDFTIDFRPKSGGLNGLWLRARYANVDFEGGEDTQDARIILNYELPF
ncbi:MAG: OprD family porin, partial [Gammaproteobacteria bacterium]|nr:OprD family porin [Gammaproteobacteria bacterium]